MASRTYTPQSLHATPPHAEPDPTRADAELDLIIQMTASPIVRRAAILARRMITRCDETDTPLTAEQVQLTSDELTSMMVAFALDQTPVDGRAN